VSNSQPWPGIAAWIFDCDGTLVDSEEPGLEVLHALALEEGLSLSLAEARQRFRGVRMADCVAWIAARRPGRSAGFEAEFTARVRRQTERRFRQGLQPMPGAPELLATLRAQGQPMAVATNGPREKVELSLGLTGLRDPFGPHVYCAYEVGSFKPEPGLFLHAARALGVAPQHCAVVEDSLPGLQAALAAGMQPFSLHPRTGLPDALVQRVHFIERLSDLGV